MRNAVQPSWMKVLPVGLLALVSCTGLLNAASVPFPDLSSAPGRVQTDSVWLGSGMLKAEDYLRLRNGDLEVELMTQPPASWEYNCDVPSNAYDFEVIGKGIKCQSSVYMDLPDPSTIDFAVVEVVYKGTTINPSSLTIKSNSESFNVSGVSTSPSGGFYYRRAYYLSPSYIEVPSIGNKCNAQSIQIYIFRKTDRNVSTSGTYVNTWLYQTTKCLTLDLATADHPRPVLVTVPLSEITNDGRVAIVRATAKPSNTQAEIIINNYNQGDALNITPFVIEQVPGTDNKVEICVISPTCNSSYGCGQSLVLATGISAESNCEATPYDWSFDCADGKTVELFGKGIKSSVPTTVTIPNASNVYQVVAEVVYKGENPGPYVYFVDASNRFHKAYRETPVGASSNVWVYRTSMPGTSSVRYTETAKSSSVQSILVYAFRQNVPAVVEQGRYTNLSGYNDLKTIDFAIPAGSASRNIQIELPISELTDDGRYLLAKATAGGKSAQMIIYGPDPSLGSCCLNIVRMTIPDVPGATTNVQITIDTRHKMNGETVNGQSYVIAGVVRSSEMCMTGCPVALEYDFDQCSGSNPFAPSKGLSPSYINTADCPGLEASKMKRLLDIGSSCTSNTPFQSGYAIRLPKHHLSSWSDNGQKAFDFTITIPECVQGKLTTFQFWNNAPYKSADGNINGYPKKYGFRILKNGSEIYQKIDIATSYNGWKQEVHSLEGINGLEYTGGEVYRIEVMAYDPKTSGDNEWLIDQFEVLACCSTTSNEIDFTYSSDICVDNPAYFLADDAGPGTYSWNFGPGAMPQTATGKGPHFVTWGTMGLKSVTLEYTEGGCNASETKEVLVKECNDIECGLISVTVESNSDCYSSTGELYVDVCESCGTQYPITVYYKENGIQKQAGPFQTDGKLLTGLPPGVYTDIYIVDATGCFSNKVGPVVITASGVSNVSNEKCEKTICIITDKLENDGKYRTFWIPGLPNLSDPRFKWQTEGRFTVLANGTATLTGTIVSVVNPNYGFNVTINLANRKTWPQWSAMGRNYKGCSDNNPNNNEYHKEWEYYEILSTSKLVGIGSYSGTLNLSHRPSNYTYGFQIGLGANAFNCDVPGASAWFHYQGTLNNKSYSGEGDINGLGGCGSGINDPSPEIPVLTCPPCKTVQCDESLSPNSLGNPVVNCENLTCSLNYSDSFSGKCPRILTRTWTASCSGKSASCIQEVVILDTEPPVLNPTPGDLTVECHQVPAPPTVQAQDNCGAKVSYAEIKTPGNCPDNYILKRTWLATDSCGNTDHHTQIITVKDIKAPVLPPSMPDLVVNCGEEIPCIWPPVSDNCSEILWEVSQKETPGLCEGSFVIVRTYTARDSCGNSSSVTQKITVNGQNPPMITECVPDITLSDCDSQVPPPDSTGLKYKSVMCIDDVDDCKKIVDCVTVGIIDIVDNGNTKTYNISVKSACHHDISYVAFSLPGIPALSPPDGSIYSGNLGNYHVENPTNNPFYSIKFESIGDPFNQGETEVFVFTLPSGVVYDSLTFQVKAATYTYKGGINLKECREEPVYIVEWKGDSLNAGTGCIGNQKIIFRKWRVTDECGQYDECEQRIVFPPDTTPPTFSEFPADQTVECDNVPGPGSPKGSDDCDNTVQITYLGEAKSNGPCQDRYSLIRTWKAEDDCGNKSTRSQKITVIDSKPPVVQCPSDKTIECSADFTPAGAGFATSTDNCDPDPLETYTDATIPGSCPDNYTIVRTWKATDRCGNMSTTCNHSILIRDKTKPVVSCPSDKTIECSADYTPAGAGIATSTDNCDPDPVETYTDATIPGSCPDNYTIVRTWKATDRCGNTSTTCNQSILIRDKTKPVVSCPTDKTIECSADFTPAGAGVATSTDNCDPDPVETYTDATIPGSCTDNYTIVRTWKATDRCGNTSTTCNQSILIRDTTKPIVSCPTDKTIECSADFTPTGAGFAT
ncbi:MAG: hypothetical protein J5I41_00815, partial [Saprospiraceae bacterium]|nr:hypothetical protein [Saprospiraceae bacterium]